MNEDCGLSDDLDAAVEGRYEPPARIAYRGGHLAARIDGSDGRIGWISSKTWPAPALHLPFLRAWVHSTGPGTERRTSLVARATTWSWRRFLVFLADRHGDEVNLEEIAEADVREFRESLPEGRTKYTMITELRVITRALFELGLCDRGLWEAAKAYAGRAESDPEIGLAPELFAEVVAAATRDVRAVADRIFAGEHLLSRYRRDQTDLTGDERRLGALLDELARTGVAPRGGRMPDGEIWWTAIPKMLFPTRSELTPMMVLLAARTGRNSETIKELDADHSIREGLLVEVSTIKRRRGYESEGASWEIGGPTRQYRTAGGVYLLIHAICARSRELAGTNALLSAWASGKAGGRNVYPWEHDMVNVGLPNLPKWTQSHGLTEDGLPLRLTFGRLKTTVDRDRAKANDFELDRAAVTNTPGVLYSSYVAPDPTARRALQSITNGALVELDERLTAIGSAEKSRPISTRPPITDEPNADKTAYLGCRNVLGHPTEEGEDCTASFLDCFGCPCAVVSDENIPTILRLSEELAERFDTISLDVWVRRYGQAWLAINNDILPSRTAEELAEFAAEMPEQTALVLLDEMEMF